MTDIHNLNSQSNQKLLEKFRNDFNLIIENIPENILLKLGNDSISWYHSFQHEMVTKVNTSGDTILSELIDDHAVKDNLYSGVTAIEEEDHIIKEDTLEDLTEPTNVTDSDYETVKRRLSSVQKELHESIEELEEKENTIKLLKKQLKDKALDTSEEIEKYENNIEELEDKNEKLGIEIKNITKQLKSTKEDLYDFEKKIEAKDNLIKSTRSQLRGSISEEEKEKYVKEIGDLKKICSVKDKVKKQLSSECEDLKKVVESAEKKVKEKETELSSVNLKMLELESKLESSFKILKEKEDILQKKELAMTTMKSKIKTSLDKTSNENVDVREMEGILYNKTLEIEQMEAKLDNYKDALEKKFAECDLQKKYIERCKEELNTLKQHKFQENYQLRNQEVPVFQVPLLTSEKSVVEQIKPLKPQYPDWWKVHMFK